MRMLWSWRGVVRRTLCRETGIPGQLGSRCFQSCVVQFHHCRVDNPEMVGDSRDIVCFGVLAIWSVHWVLVLVAKIERVDLCK